MKDSTPSDDPPDSERAAHRAALSEAGVARVKAFERAANRDPREMDHHHPGFDIESRDQSGEIARYIEVNSLSGQWGQDGVGVTYAEFEKAQQLGDKYWLYVVERADQPEARIFPIQDPARKVDQFRYDDGWSEAAESP